MSKLALITGGTSGIGLSIAKKFAGLGINIALNGKTDNPTNFIQSLKSDYKVDFFYHNANMLNFSEIEDFYSKTKEKYGKSPDILVNNAGIQYVSPVENFPNEKFEEIIKVNLISVFYLTKLIIPDMKVKKFGRIVNIASAHGLVASPFKSAYVAAKHGVVGFGKSVALETAQDGITINAICPGYVDTPLVRNQIADTARARGLTEEEVIKNVILEAQPTKKLIGLDEIADLAAFLISDNAKSITGSTFSIDGGWTAK